MDITVKAPQVITAENSPVYAIGAANFTATLKVPVGAVDGLVSIIEHTLRPRTLAAPLHRHSREDEITYVITGELTVLQNGELTTVTAGNYVTKPRGIWHTFWNAGETDVNMIEVIAPGGFEAYFAELKGIIPQAGMPDINALVALGARYGLEFDFSSMPELLGKYQLNT